MAYYRLSNKARQELEDIYIYSLLNFGVKQADYYLEDLHDALLFLAENPNSGRRCDYIKDSYRRHEHGQHVIFYTQSKSDILITRVLGVKQDPEMQFRD